MKTSNIIILSYSVLVIGGLLTLFIDSKQHPRNHSSEYEYDLKKSELSDFNVIVAEKDADIHINQTDSNTIAIECPKEAKIPEKLYSLSNDTLYIHGKFRTWVNCKKVSSIISHKHRWLGIDFCSTDSLSLNLNGGETYITKNDPQIVINHLRIEATENSYVQLNNTHTKTIDLRSDNDSKIRLYGKYNKVDATITSKSEIYFSKNPKELSVVKDSTSIFTCYK